MKKIIGLAVATLFSGQIFAGDATIGQTKIAVCSTCHAADGNGPLAANPKLAGQSEKYLAKQIRDFKSKARDNAVMFGMASMVLDEDIDHIAAYYATQKVQYAAVEEKHIPIAEKIYRGGDTDRDIPACLACHGAKGHGVDTAGYPAIGGQHPEYTITTLKAFRNGDRKNDENEIMRDVVAKMSDAQIEALAYYLAGLH